MFPRLPSWALNAPARVRGYSTLGGPSGSSGFLSDLMKRIDTINMKTEKIAQTKGPVAGEKFVRAKGGQKMQGQQKSQGQQRKQSSQNQNQQNQQNMQNQQNQQNQQKSQRQQKQSFTPRTQIATPAKARIAVKDHPLSSNMFKLMDEKNFSKSPRQGGFSGPREGQNRGQFQDRSQNRPQQRTQQFGERRPGARRTGPNRAKPMQNRARKSAQPASIVPKKLQSAALRPVLNGDVFLHGKPAKLGVSTSSRVAAVAKECLLKSQYPYKLPKSIVENIDERFSGNRYLLQKDWNLNVDPEHFQDRIRKVVKGEAEVLSVSKDASPAEKDARLGLMANGGMSMENKQTIYDVVSGLKSAQDLMKNAVWNK